MAGFKSQAGNTSSKTCGFKRRFLQFPGISAVTFSLMLYRKYMLWIQIEMYNENYAVIIIFRVALICPSCISKIQITL